MLKNLSSLQWYLTVAFLVPICQDEGIKFLLLFLSKGIFCSIIFDQELQKFEWNCTYLDILKFNAVILKNSDV